MNWNQTYRFISLSVSLGVFLCALPSVSHANPLRMGLSSRNAEDWEQLVSKGTLEDLQASIGSGKSPEQTNKGGQTALLLAVSKGRGDMVKTLLDAGANVDAQDKSAVSALMLAAKQGRTDLVQLLLGSGAKATLLDKNGQSALHWILKPKERKKSFLDNLGDYVPEIGKAKQQLDKLSQNIQKNPLMAGLTSQFLKGIVGDDYANSLVKQYLPGLSEGKNFNPASATGWLGVVGQALQGKLEVDTLYSADIKAGQWVSLLKAAGSKDKSLLVSELSNVAVTSPAVRQEWNQFLTAAANGDGATVEALMKSKALAPVLSQARTGLSAALAQVPGRDGGTGIAKLLIKAGAQIDAVDKKGVSPRKRAADSHLEALEALLREQEKR